MSGAASLWSVQALLVFVIAILVDCVWALYIRRVNAGQAVAAANYAVGIMALAAINTISYTQNAWLLLPIVVGNWLGTWGVIAWDQRKKG